MIVNAFRINFSRFSEFFFAKIKRKLKKKKQDSQSPKKFFSDGLDLKSKENLFKCSRLDCFYFKNDFHLIIITKYNKNCKTTQFG